MPGDDMFGARLRELRVGNGLSLRALSRVIHYSTAQISRVETGISRPTVEFAVLCDRALDTGGELGRLAARSAARPRRATHPSFAPPLEPTHFVGRHDDVTSLIQYLKPSDGNRSPDHARICVLHGIGGAGKTALAIRLARLLRDQYQDGCIYVDLEGYRLHGNPHASSDVVASVLRQLGVPGELIPDDVGERAAQYRQLMSDKRVLLILDGVKSSDQVRPLIPPIPTSAVLVTGRAQLTSLDDALQWQVKTLDRKSAIHLFHLVADLPEDLADRGDPELVGSIVELCGRLPLAVRIVAARFRDNWSRTLEDVALRLTDEKSRFEELDDGERSMMGVFSASCASLSPDQHRILVLIAHHPGSRIDTPSVAALEDRSSADAELVLDRLKRAGLLEHHSRNAYRLHDLFRAYLRRTWTDAVSAEELDVARRNLFEYYVRAADAADRAIVPHRHRITLSLQGESRTQPDFADFDSAMAWMSAELENFPILLKYMTDAGYDELCWQFAYCLRGYFYEAKQWDVWVDCYHVAADAAARTRDRRAEGLILNNQGMALSRLGRHREAEKCYVMAEGAFRDVNDVHGEINAVKNRSWLYYYEADYENALRLGRRCYDFYRSDQAEWHAAIALRCVARAELELGMLEEATADLRTVLADYERLGFRPKQIAKVYIDLGRAVIGGGDRDGAIDYLKAAIDQARSGSGIYEEAIALESLGDIVSSFGKHEEADQHKTAALDLYSAIGAPEAKRLRPSVARPASTEPSLKAGRTEGPTVLAVATEWSSGHGGLSTFNRRLCVSLAEAGAEVFCYVPVASDAEVRDAAVVGIELVIAKRTPGEPRDKSLTRRPALPAGAVPDAVIGHGRKTGPAAVRIVEDYFTTARRVHFMHTIADHVEFDKVAPEPGLMERGEERVEDEWELARGAALAYGVGPVLHDRLCVGLGGYPGARTPLRFDPGFDIAEPGLNHNSPRGGRVVQILIAGRLGESEADIKGLDLAVRAIAYLLELRDPREPEIELVIRGVPIGGEARLRELVEVWTDGKPVRILPRAYTARAEVVEQDMRRATLVVMPSRTEGFGLVGLEAIVAEKPVLVSGSSGLGVLLDELLPHNVAGRVVVPIKRDKFDVRRWGEAIRSVLMNPEAAGVTAATVREVMASKRTWEMAAKGLLDALRTAPIAAGTEIGMPE
ncbi:glycosyltransferase [Saccharothrix sp. Mg75]|uniref:glycosyltransferase n=1 Tax=Saccharothrix sp. Mg75 TaxID=3445357 RepID=UPI003EED382A